ncbi:MAG: siphovirus Gp157 family protein [Muribaculaceae bacterium]|nr:siphovirus Gp157 family protein [Muribaculaceae bacterium]
MPNIYKLGEDYLMLIERLADTVDDNGVVDASLLPAVSEARELIESKAQSIGCVVKQLNTYKNQIDEEVNRLQAMSKTLEKRIDYLKTAVSRVLQKCDIVRIDGIHAVISFRASKETVIDDESEIPDEYIATKIETKLDKTKIKNAIAAGMFVPGAHIESKQNIQIR